MNYEEFYNKIRDISALSAHGSYIGVLVTTMCPVGCSHCLLACDVSKGRDIDYDSVLRWLLPDIKFTPVKTICLTGGEPFFRFKILKHLCKSFSNAGLRTDIVTSAYWASSESVAKKVLNPLIKSGISGISFSSDEFHQENIPSSYIRNAVTAAKDAGLNISISYRSTGSCDNLAAFNFLSNTLGDTISQISHFTVGGTQPLGRACHLEQSGIATSEEGPLRLCPAYSLTIFPPDIVFSCCGGYPTDLSPLVLGHPGDRPFSEVYYQWRNSLISLILEVAGITQLLKIARDNNLEDDLPNDPDPCDTCSLCKKILSSDERVDLFFKYFNKPERIRHLAVLKLLTTGDHWPLLHLNQIGSSVSLLST